VADKEIYDYVSTVTPDNNVTLQVTPAEVSEIGYRNQVVHLGDDETEEVVDLGGGSSIFKVTLSWSAMSASDAGTLLDYYHDSNKGNGMADSFKWEHPTDGHTYVVKFRSDVQRAVRQSTMFRYAEITLKIMGRIAD